MALLDLSSDLSRFRSQISREEKNTPESSKATNNKNFATFQPITERVSSLSPAIKKLDSVKPLETKLSSIKTDDIVNFARQNLLINSVSKYSSINRSYSEDSLRNVQTSEVESRFNKIQQKEFVSNLYKSNVVILKPTGDKNTTSPVDIVLNPNDSSDNIQNPNITITTPPLSLDRTKTSPVITKNLNDSSDNVENPNIVINTIPLTFDRKKSSPLIVIKKNDTSDNIQNPNIDILRKSLSFDRASQSPIISTQTIKQGLVVNPNTDIIKIENGIFHLEDESKLNPSGKTIRFISESKLVKKEIREKKDTQRYDGTSGQLKDNSRLNLDSVIKTIPYGRNENPNKSKLSIVGTQSVNFFKDDNATGFIVNAKRGESQYKESSSFVWKGTGNAAPVTNFMVDVNGKGFTKFANIGETLYNTNSSKFGFTSTPQVDFFDSVKKYTSEGFEKFTTIMKTAYQPDASTFTWPGGRTNAPETNYFDKESKNTTIGFHKFAKMYDTKYVSDSSLFNWDGSRESAPEVNYFDISGKNTNMGFHKFAQVYDTKFIPESSLFDWDGNRESAPNVNYFDVTAKNTTTGFHTFAQLYDTKYVPESSLLDWDGTKINAPEVNYFDLTAKNTTAGFHRFAQLYDTKYVPESSLFDWDGNRESAPEVNYFDLTAKNTTAGFHRLAQIYDTKYAHESSRFDWDGNRNDAPSVNYFDIGGKNTSIGFHTFAQIYDTKYVPESSRFDWDGNRNSSPEVNYFDISGKFTTNGFHRLAELYDTKYVPESSRFDWDGGRTNAPEVNYFDISGKVTTKGFHKLAELYDSKYVKGASKFDWDGTTTSAPTTNFFQDRYNSGFKTFAQKLKSEYVRDISEFTFKGSQPDPVDFFSNTNSSGFTIKIPILESKYVSDISRFAFKGTTPNPVDFFTNNNVDGFTIKVNKNETNYKTESSRYTFKGNRSSAPSVDYIGNQYANGFVNLMQHLKTEYAEKQSKFTWVGSRGDAPSVDFFKIPAQNSSGISGFDTFFIDKTSTKYSDKLSSLSAESSNKKSAVKNIPYTTFFGYRPQERTGFMVNMSTFDGTLFPIINPKLKFDYNLDARTQISIVRSENPANLKTGELENYAPLSLGKRPWANGTLFSTLDSQIPNLKTKAPAGSYTNKYERSMKDTTEKLGYLTKWAITRRSPSPLDDQYSKYKLQDESVNREVAVFNQPYVVRGIQRVGEVENQRWGFGVTFDDGIIRGGTTTQAERILQDVVRIGKFTLSAKGALFNIKQLGLQAMNPVVDVDPKIFTNGVLGISSTLLYNPLSLIGNVATARAGGHYARHGINPLDSDYLNKYGTSTVNRELKERFTDPNYTSFDRLPSPSIINNDPGGYNRLIGLMKELLPSSFKPSTRPKPQFFGSMNLLNFLRGSSVMNRVSSNFGGPNSFLGIGGTKINRASHPYLGSYTTSPMLFNESSETSYLESAKRDTFYAASRTYRDSIIDSNSQYKGILEALIGLLESGPENPAVNTSPSDLNETLELQKDTKTRIVNSSTFEPRYENIVDRISVRNNYSAKKEGSELYRGPDSKIIDSDSDPIKKYRTLAYNKLQKVKPGISGRSALFNDFRHDLESSGSESFITHPGIARYDTRNLENYFGLGKYGKPGAQRNIPYNSNVVYSKSEKGINKLAGSATNDAEAKKFQTYSVPKLKPDSEFRGDRINIIDYKRANFDISHNLVYEQGAYNDNSLPGSKDLVEFYFSSLVLSGHNYCPAEVIVFRATFDSITDNHKPSWNSVKYMGRADPLYTYQGYERSISFGFTVHIGSRDEMKASWRKLNYLSSWTAPEYTKAGFMRAPMIRLNIGNLYRKMPGYISNLSYTFDNSNGYWETAHLYEDQRMDGANKDLSTPGALQLPKNIQVSCEFVPVGVYRPEFRGVMYSLYDDKNGDSLENGLIPIDNTKVNYFKTFDDMGIDGDQNKYNLTIPPGDENKPLDGKFEDSPQSMPGTPGQN